MKLYHPLQTRKSEWLSILMIAIALLGGILIFKETSYVLPLTIFLTTVIITYVSLNFRRKNSLKNSSEKSKQEDKASPDEHIKNQE